MRRFFIFLSAIALLATSCQKEAIQNTVSQAPERAEANPLFIPGGPVSSGKFKLVFATVLPAPSSVSSLPALPDTIPAGSAELQFWAGSFFQFNDGDSVTATESIGQDSLKHLYIDAKKYPNWFEIYIMGRGPQISPGLYFAPNNSTFIQMVSYGWEAVGYVEQDFSLKVLSYGNGYLDAVFHSSHVTNGVINHLKIIQ